MTDPREVDLRLLESSQKITAAAIHDITIPLTLLSLICTIAPELDQDYDEFLQSRLYKVLLHTQDNPEAVHTLITKWVEQDDAICELDDKITLGEPNDN